MYYYTSVYGLKTFQIKVMLDFTYQWLFSYAASVKDSNFEGEGEEIIAYKRITRSSNWNNKKKLGLVIEFLEVDRH